MSENNEQIDEILIDENQENLTIERIGFGRRLGAYMLDFLVVLIFGSILGLLVGDSLAPLFFGDEIDKFDELSSQFDDLDFDVLGMMNNMMGIAAGMSVITVVLFILEGALGQSPGKMMLNIINTNIEGNKAAAGKLWLRAALKYGSTLLSLIGGIAGVAILGSIGSLWGFIIFIGFFFVFGDNKQTIHDMIAKTVVSRK